MGASYITFLLESGHDDSFGVPFFDSSVEPGHFLANSNVGHDFLAASVNGRDLVAALEGLDSFSHAGSGECPSAKDLAGVVCDHDAGAGGVQLEEGDGGS